MLINSCRPVRGPTRRRDSSPCIRFFQMKLRRGRGEHELWVLRLIIIGVLRVNVSPIS